VCFTFNPAFRKKKQDPTLARLIHSTFSESVSLLTLAFHQHVLQSAKKVFTFPFFFLNTIFGGTFLHHSRIMELCGSVRYMIEIRLSGKCYYLYVLFEIRAE